jgi:hypothetical protein
MRKSVLLLAALLLPALVFGQDWRGPAALEVRVEDAKGRNLAGAEVLLVYLSPDGGGQLPSVLTDANGHADIGGLAAGRWSVEVRHAGQMSYRAEIALPADGKPVVQSASHVMAPGATSTMKVKFSRGRSGGSAPPAPRSEPLPPPVAQAPAPKAPVVEAPPVPVAPPTPVREPAPVPEPRPVAKPAPPVPPVSSAPGVALAEKPPVKVAPPVAAPPAPEKAPVREVPPVAAVPPTAPPVVAPAPAKASVKEVPPQAAVPPTAAPVVAPAPVVQPPTVPAQPTPAPAAPLPAKTPPSASPVVAAPPAAPAAQRARLCVECPPGESAAWGEAAIEGGATAGCPADIGARLKNVDLEAVATLSSELAAGGAGCRVIAVELPAGARFTGFRYEAQSAGLAADCLPGRGCPSGGCRFPNEPVLRQDGKRTVLLVAFESTAADMRRAVVAGYSTYSKR